MYLKLLTMGGQAATASSASLSPIFSAVLIGIALGAFIFYGICKIGIPKNADRNEKYYLQGIYRLLAVICLFLIISVSVGVAIAISVCL